MTQPTPESKPVEQQYTYQVDQQVSVNSFIDISVDGETVRFQVTNRYGATPEKIVKTVEAQVEAWKKLRALAPKPVQVAPAPEPTRVAIDDNGKEQFPIKFFIAEKLSFTNQDGKIYWKVKGGSFSQWGVTVWPETLKACGLNIEEGQPLPDINGWTVEYVEYEKDGKIKPQKVMRLLKPK